MTTITIDRAVVEQALEVLKFCTPKPRPTDDDYAEQGWKEHNAAITALRAALTQQAEPVEPVAWIESPHGAIRANPNYKFTFPSQLLHWQIPLYTAPPQQVAQQAEPLNLSDPAVQKRLASQWGYVPAAAQAEPVAWMFESERNFNLVGYGGWEKRITECRPNALQSSVRNVTALYTAPPQRKPLTEEVAALTAQRDALLEALKMIAGETPCFDNLMGDKDIARAAIKAVEETK